MAAALSPNQLGQVLRDLPTGQIGVLGAGSVDGGDGAFTVRFVAETTADGAPAVEPRVATFGAPFVTGLWANDGSGFLLGPESIVRFDASGAVDSSFGSGSLPGARAGALTPDGKLWTGSGSVVSRFLVTGSPDGAFGSGGSVDLGWQPTSAMIQTIVGAPTGGAVIVGFHFTDQKTYLDLATVGVDGSPVAAFDPREPTQIEDAPLGAARLSDETLIVWTSGADVVAVARDGSIEGLWNLGLQGTVLAGTMDSSGRLVVVGIGTADPTNSAWFIRRYMFF